MRRIRKYKQLLTLVLGIISSRKTIYVLGLLAYVLIVTIYPFVQPATTQAAIGGKRVAVRMPFDGGGTTGNQSTTSHHHFWNAWSWDLHTAAGTAVKPRVVTGDGAITMTVAGVPSPTCRSNDVAQGGLNVRVNISVDGIYVGQVLYGHLSNVQVANGNSVNANTVLGYTKTYPLKYPNSSTDNGCIQDYGSHTHAEFSKGCYRNLPLNTFYNGGAPIAMLSSSYQGNNVSSCDENEVNAVNTATPPSAQASPAKPGDYDGDGFTDRAVYRPSDGTWHISAPGIGDLPNYGQSGDIPVPADYNGDGKTDVAVYRPSTGYWYIRGIGDYKYGEPGDIPVPGVWNATQPRTTQMAVYRPSTRTWHIRTVGDLNSYGEPGDIPVPGDWNGQDGFTDRAVYRPSDGTWHIEGIGDYQYGQPGDVPVPADYDGNGRVNAAVYRPSDGTWHIREMGDFSHGQPGDIPVPGVFYTATPNTVQAAVYRPSTGTWHIRYVGDTTRYGEAGDIPVIQTTNIMLLRQYGFNI